MKAQSAIRLLIGLISVILVFHLLILVKIIPYDVTWGGRLKSDNEMYLFEGISIAVNGILLLLLFLKGRIISQVKSSKFIDIVLWIYLVLFSLNTIGNLLAESTFEKFFAILTLVFVFLLLVILRGGKKTQKS